MSSFYNREKGSPSGWRQWLAFGVLEDSLTFYDVHRSSLKFEQGSPPGGTLPNWEAYECQGIGVFDPLEGGLDEFPGWVDPCWYIPVVVPCTALIVLVTIVVPAAVLLAVTILLVGKQVDFWPEMVFLADVQVDGMLQSVVLGVLVPG